MNKPQITLNVRDHERLTALASSAGRLPELASILAEELERADVVADEDALHCVRMGREVEYRDDTTGKVRTVTLVEPADADISQGKISVLTPVGIALIGLSPGASITWTTRIGEVRQLTVLKTR